MKFTVIGEFVPFVVNEFAIMGGLLGVEVERSDLAAVTCVGAPEVSGGRESCSRGGDLVSLGRVGAYELTLFGE